VLDQALSEDDVNRVREITRQMLGLDASRGDTLDIQRSAFRHPNEDFVDSGIYRLQRGLRNYWLVISASLVLFCIAVFFLFMFGPLRGFLNHSVQVLATLKPNESAGNRGSDLQLLSTMLGHAGVPMLGAGGGAQGPAGNASFSGSLQVENPTRKVLPFGFVREDSLSNLAILLSRETPERAAVVLGYLPPEWISRVLARLDQNFQTEVASSLATARQLSPEQVEDIEQDLKRRLDYLVGGPDRLIAIYESLEPDAQKRMLDSLRESRPDLADDLRSRTMLFEDVEKLEAPALKALLREIDMQTLVASLRGSSEAFRRRVLENVSEGKAEMIREELQIGEGTGGRVSQEAQRKILVLARRLQREGQIHVPQINDGAPQTRYPSLRSTLKLPPGIRAADRTAGAKDAEIIPGKSNLQDRIKKFMSKGAADKERFPSEGKDEPKGS
jgi:flagellar motor switch protein FliG